MSVLAVIDTNVLVSALIARRNNTPPLLVLSAVDKKHIVPILHGDILDEYDDVLNRPKFGFPTEKVRAIRDRLCRNGKYCGTVPYPRVMPDEKDRIFYEVLLAARQAYGEAYLITGNKKHFPDESGVVNAAEMCKVLGL